MAPRTLLLVGLAIGLLVHGGEARWRDARAGVATGAPRPARIAPRSPAPARPPAAPRSPAPRAGPPSAALRAIASAARDPDLRWPVLSDVHADLARLYTRAGWRPIWSISARPSEASLALTARLAAADSLGLDPADYDPAFLARAAAELARAPEPGDAALAAHYDVALSVAALRFLTALHGGRVSPAAAGAELLLPRRSFDATRAVDSLRAVERQADVVAATQPQHLHYQMLKNGLAYYRALACDTTLLRAPDLPGRVEPGMALPEAARLRKRLMAMGDLAEGATVAPEADTVYASDLVAAVRHFQLRQGLEPDGVLSWTTAERINCPFDQRVRQIELALERWRWLPRTFAAPPVLVNIPAFRLYAFRTLTDREEDILAMDVLVGAAFKGETPVFAADMKYVIFRPYWDPPAELERFELGPRARWDWENMRRLGYELLPAAANEGRPLPLTPENAGRIGKDLRLVQRPGPLNALGLIKFVLPNAHDVYLHDTPIKGFFAFSRRDMSHGCIRVADPVGLAALVLHDRPEWTVEKIEAAMNGRDNRRVDLAHPVPVYVVYATAVASEDGEMHFYSDIYGLDEKLDALLKKGYPYPRGPGRAAGSNAKSRG